MIVNLFASYNLKYELNTNDTMPFDISIQIP